MIRSTLLGVAAALALTLSASAQFLAFPSPVTCTGCPNAVTLENQGFTAGGSAMQLGSSIGVRATFPTAMPADVRASLLFFGYQTGNCSIDYSQFATFCGGGPCNWYLAPIIDQNNIADMLAISVGDSTTWMATVPNDISLVFNLGTISFQALRVNFTTGCADMSKAHSAYFSR